MGTKKDPGTFDCYANAKPDEPMFILLARDPLAPFLVRLWADLRVREIRIGMRPAADYAQVGEARASADLMESWRCENWPSPDHRTMQPKDFEGL